MAAINPERSALNCSHDKPLSISHLLLDIEGTTCPVSFVADSLFPYASTQLENYLNSHQQEAVVQELLEQVLQAWRQDPSEQARRLLFKHGGADKLDRNQIQALIDYLQLQIRNDRKLTPLKELQGMIWIQGYDDGDLRAPLYEDVPEALRRWHRQGLVLAVYSSGSVAAQKLLYGHTSVGDLSGLISHWFDTRIGAKTDAKSYAAVAAAMDCQPASVLFISDRRAELEAASAEGMAVLFSDRPGNPERDPGTFERITNFEEVILTH
ncbi:MAG: acireductone synthase [Cyanobium sp.]|jgi:enolase-phosphatase E1